MNTLKELQTFALAWYNLPFSLSLLVFLGLSALQFIGLDQDHDLEAEADFDLEGEIELEVDLDHDVEPEVSDILGWSEILQFLGVGQVPVTMVLLLFAGGFGGSGWILNSLVVHFFPGYPGWVVIPVVGVALVNGLWVTGRTARLLGRVVPALATTATAAEQLVSRRGYVASAQVDEQYGQVKVRDRGGTLITVFAVVDPGQPPVLRDQDVFLVEYDPVKKMFVVVPVDV